MRMNPVLVFSAILMLASVPLNAAPLNQSDKAFLRASGVDASVIAMVERDPKIADRVQAIINNPNLSAAAKKKQATDLIADWVAADIAKSLEQVRKDPEKHQRALDLGDRLRR
jgi:hypothetical protein